MDGAAAAGQQREGEGPGQGGNQPVLVPGQATTTVQQPSPTPAPDQIPLSPTSTNNEELDLSVGGGVKQQAEGDDARPPSVKSNTSHSSGSAAAPSRSRFRLFGGSASSDHSKKSNSASPGVQSIDSPPDDLANAAPNQRSASYGSTQSDLSASGVTTDSSVSGLGGGDASTPTTASGSLGQSVRSSVSVASSKHYAFAMPSLKGQLGSTDSIHGSMGSPHSAAFGGSIFSAGPGSNSGSSVAGTPGIRIFPPFISMTLDTIIDAVIVANGAGLILEYNKAAVNMFGWSKDEVIGRKPLNILMPNKYAKNHDRYMSEYRNGGTPKLIGITRTLRGLRKDGSTFPVDVSLGQFPKEWLSNLNDDEVERYLQGGLFVGTLRDVTRREREKEDWSGSRYGKEFEEMEFLGKGGFGAVFRARNRLDGQEYAIKKIRLRCHPSDYAMAMAALTAPTSSSMHVNPATGSVASGSVGEPSMGAASIESAGSGSAGGGTPGSIPSGSTPPGSGNATGATTATATATGSLSPDDLRIIREVKTFARISNHPNVVRYYNSWVEAVWSDEAHGKSGSESEKEKQEMERKERAEREKQAADAASQSHMQQQQQQQQQLQQQQQQGLPPKPLTTPPPPIPARAFPLPQPSPVPAPANLPLSPITSPESVAMDSPPSEAEAEAETETIELSQPGGAGMGLEDMSANFYTPEQMRAAEQDMLRRKLAKKRLAEVRGKTAAPASATDAAPQVKIVFKQDSNEFERAEGNNMTDEDSIDSGTTGDSNEFSMHPRQSRMPSLGESKAPAMPARPAAILEKGGPPPVPPRGPAPPAVPQPPATDKKKSKKDQQVPQPNDIPTGEASTILFIQMQLCSSFNLHKWLQNRNASRKPVDPHQNMIIFRQICSGLAHVHAGGFIHRDIKPANVFLENEHVFLGDFGLAKDISQRALHAVEHPEEMDPFWNDMVERKGDGSSSESDGDVVLKEGWEETFTRKLAEEQDHPLNVTQTNLTLGVGTLLYASPEQLSRRRYDAKTDIYSLGVLFFELYFPFTTPVERVYTLMELRKGVVPQQFKQRYPAEWQLLRRMIATDPKERPSALEILVSDLVRDHDMQVYHRASTTPNLHAQLRDAFPRKRASSATGEGVSFSGASYASGHKGTSGTRGRSLGAQRASRLASPLLPQSSSGSERSKGRHSGQSELSSSRLQTEVGELMERSSGSASKDMFPGRHHHHHHSHHRYQHAGGEHSTTSLPSRASGSTTSTSTTSDSDDFNGDDFDPEESSYFGTEQERTHGGERKKRNAARFAAMQRRADDVAAGRPACVECKEKDIMILALRERNKKLMDRVHELERELQLLRSGGNAAGIAAIPSEPQRPAVVVGGAGAGPGPSWGLAGPGPREPPAIPARPSIPGGFPRTNSGGPSGFPRPIAIPPAARPPATESLGMAEPAPSLFGMIPRPPSAPPPIPIAGRAPPAVPSRPSSTTFARPPPAVPPRP